MAYNDRHPKPPTPVKPPTPPPPKEPTPPGNMITSNGFDTIQSFNTIPSFCPQKFVFETINFILQKIHRISRLTILLTFGDRNFEF